LSPGVSPGFVLRGQWAAGQHYLAADSVVYAGKFYRANVAHDSTNLNRPDLDPVKWLFLFSTVDLAGAMSIATYDPTGIGADVFARANHTGTQAISTVSGLQAALDAKLALAGGTMSGALDMAFNAISNPAGVLLTKFMTGLRIANNATDSTNDLDIAAGAAASEATTPALIILSAGITKRLDANWAVGSGNGGRYSGAAITDTTYHVWLVSKSDGTGTDVYLDPSASVATVLSHIQAETGGALYTRATRIGSVIRSSGAILGFTHVGRNAFILNAAYTARNSTAALAASLLTFAVPSGIQCEPLLQTRLDWNATSMGQIAFGAASAGNITTTVHLSGGNSAGNSLITHYGGFLSNTSQQIYAAQGISVGSLSSGSIANFGWIDTFL